MSTKRLRPEFRARMRELIQGFIEHCEISRSLVGQIERFVDHQDRKYGFPTFTIYGPPHPNLDTRFVNVIGVNEGEDASAAEVLLQLIERIVLQSHLATGIVLRVLPVTNPVALEAVSCDPQYEDAAFRAQLRDALEGFCSLPVDGTIEVRLSDGELLTLNAFGPAPVLGAAAAAERALRSLHSELSSDSSVVVARRFPEDSDHPWRLHLELPRAWPGAVAVHWASQALIVFLRTHLEAVLHQSTAAFAVGHD